MNESDTPRTDAMMQSLVNYMDSTSRPKLAGFARQLERDLNSCLQKDSLKTREINVLTKENRELKAMIGIRAV